MPTEVINDFEKEHLINFLGQKVTFHGKAINSKLGAFLEVNKKRIWIKGMDSWPEGFYLGGEDGKLLEVTGVLIEKHDLPVYIHKEGEPYSAMIAYPPGTDLKKASHRYLLEDPKWVIIKNLN